MAGQPKCVALALGLLCSLGSNAGSVSSSYAPTTLNTLVALESTQEALAGLLLVGSAEKATPLSGQWSGTVDASGWALGFNGQWGGQAVTLQHAGLLDLQADRATWSFAGAMGGEGFNGEGRIDFDPSWWSLLIKGVVHLVVYGTQTLTDGGTFSRLASEGVVWVADQIIELYNPEVAEVTPLPGSTEADVQSRLLLMNNAYLFRQSGHLGVDGSLTYSTVASVVPEASTVWLWMAGLSGLTLVLALRRTALDRQTGQP